MRFHQLSVRGSFERSKIASTLGSIGLRLDNPLANSVFDTPRLGYRDKAYSRNLQTAHRRGLSGHWTLATHGDPPLIWPATSIDGLAPLQQLAIRLPDGHGSTPGYDNYQIQSAPQTTHAENPSGDTNGELYLDGTSLGQWVSDHLENALLRPRSGVVAVDVRAVPSWGGSYIGI